MNVYDLGMSISLNAREEATTSFLSLSFSVSPLFTNAILSK